MKKNLLTGVALLALLTCSAQQFQSVFTFGGANTDVANAMAHDTSGNLITGGYFLYTCDFDPGAGVVNLTETGNSGSGDAFIASYTQSGTLNWAINFGNTQGEMVTALDVDAAGNIYATGIFSGTVDIDPGAGVTNLVSGGYYDWFVAKYTTTGTLVWAASLSQQNNDMPRCIRVNQPGVYVGGYVGMGNTRTPYMAAWNTTTGVFGFSGACFGNDHGQVEKIEFTPSGDMYMAGYFRGTTNFDLYTGNTSATSNGSDDAFLAKYSTFPAFTLQWVKTFGGTDFDEVFGMELKNFDIMLTGVFAGTMDADPGAGTTTLTGTGITNTFISQFNSSGTLVYAVAINATGTNDQVNPVVGIELAPNGTELLVSGNFKGTVDFDPSAATNTISSAGSAPDAFIATYTYNGALVSVKTIEGQNTMQSFAGLAVYPTGDIFAVGNFNGNFTNFDPGNTNVMVNGVDNIFVAHYYQCVTTSTIVHDTICQGDVYNWGSQQYTVTGWYPDTVTSIHGCDSALSLHLYVVNLYAAPPTQNGDTLLANNTGTFQWIDCNTGLPIAGATNATFVPTASGSYALELTWAGCTATSTCVTVNLNSVNESANGNNSVLFPNPAADHFTIAFDQPVNKATITVCDVTGKVVLTSNMTSANQTEIYFDGAPGIYFVTVSTEDSSIVHRLVKE